MRTFNNNVFFWFLALDFSYFILQLVVFVICSLFFLLVRKQSFIVSSLVVIFFQ